MAKSKVLISLNVDILAYVDVIAENMGISRSALVSMILYKWLERNKIQ